MGLEFFGKWKESQLITRPLIQNVFIPGPYGRDGAKGETGPQGPKGDQGQAGLKGENGAQALSNWKQCVSKLYEAKDNGLLKVRFTNE